MMNQDLKCWLAYCKQLGSGIGLALACWPMCNRGKGGFCQKVSHHASLKQPGRFLHTPDTLMLASKKFHTFVFIR